MSKKVVKNEDELVNKGEMQTEPFRKKFKVQFDIDYAPKVGKTENGGKQTVPEMHLTVRQLVENYTRGVDSGEVNMKTPFYYETYIPTFNDITDVQAHRDYLTEQAELADKWLKENATEEESSISDDSKNKEDGSNDESSTTS